ncbi:MAG: outer membrane beta-barrel domain-containing protein [Bdellovibrionia bacterium]
MKSLILLFTLFIGLSQASALDIKKDFDSLGGNSDIRKRAKDLDPNNRVRVVQNRAVDRNLRLELGINGGLVSGADSYVKTQNLGGNLDFHITPRWSLGLRYYQSYNTLTNEGQQVYENARTQQAIAGDFNNLPKIDYPIETGLAVINWYPFYGKMALFDSSVAHFDVYVLAGGGRTKLYSGSTNTYTAGGGVGIWLGQHFTTRLEGRYQTYEDLPDYGGRKVDSAVFNLGLGLLL